MSDGSATFLAFILALCLAVVSLSSFLGCKSDHIIPFKLSNRNTERDERIDLYRSSAERALLPWKDLGIAESLFESMADKFNTLNGYPAAVVGFYQGKSYLLKPLDFSKVAHHHAGVLLGHLISISELDGLGIPDVEFVIASNDEVLLERSNIDDLPWPVLRYCTKPDESNDIVVPGEFWYKRDRWTERFANDSIMDASIPWDQKKQKLVCNCGGYHRFGKFHGLGDVVDGHDVPCGDFPNCPGSRDYFRFNIVPNHAEYMIEGGLSHKIEDWSEYKYIMHLDGISCSTRLTLYLALGFTTFVEQSGYKQHFQDWLEDYKNFIPVWDTRHGQGPEDIAQKLAWLMDHDETGKNIGIEARQFAMMHLTEEARRMYWKEILRALSRTLRYTVQPREGMIPLKEHITAREGCQRWDYTTWRNKDAFVPDSSECFP